MERGDLTVPVYGGGTCNSEFEVLTGLTTSFFPQGTYPYMSYVKDGTINLGRQLKELNYYTTFMHLYNRSGWNRENEYEMFGFDEQIYFDDLINTKDFEYCNNDCFLTDKSNYDQLIDQYEKMRETEENIFIYNVTIQNHGSYQEDYNESIQIVGSEGKYQQTERYLTLLKKSDLAFGELIEYFENKEEPVIICMFGDHWPNVDQELLEAMEDMSQYDETEILAREYRTPFLIWTNYDIEEKVYDNISAGVRI